MAAIERAVTKDALDLAPEALTAEIQARVRALTPRERHVLALAITGLLNKQIASVLGVAKKTVKVHRARGGNQFFVTTGLLQKANDDRLRAILAHELSHQDLNHVAKAQILGAGLDIGTAILDQIFPGTGGMP